MSAAAEPLGESVSVLVVDDDEIVRTWLTFALKESEFYVLEDVANADEAFTALGESHPGLLLVDYRLPDMNGIELLRQVRANGLETPAVLMTASTETGLNQTALAAGFQGAYVKSGRRDALLETLRLVVSGEPAFDHRNPKGGYAAEKLDAEEREILDLVTAGLTTRELAERSGITVEEARAAFERASDKIQKRRRRPAPVAQHPKPEPEAAPASTPAQRGSAKPPKVKVLAYTERAAVLAAFLENAHQTMAGLRSQLRKISTASPGTAPGGALADYAHTLKGGAATAGLQDIAALAAQIEATARAAPQLAVDEVRRLEVLGRELDVRVERLPAADTVGLSTDAQKPSTNGGPPLATIVYIDDDPASLKLVDVLLAREPGFRLVTARSGFEGVRTVSDHQPDLVFLDLRLPDLDGLDVLARIRHLDGGDRFPVVLLTGEAQGRLASLQEAVDLVLTKPLDLGRFFEVVALLREEVGGSEAA
jgi:two-component system response regulator FixJ